MADWFDFNKKAIDIALEEYKALRQEIILLIQQRGQLLTVGFAAVVTVAGIGLTSIANLPKTEITTKTTQEFTSQSQSNPTPTPQPITTEVLITEVTNLDPNTNKPIENSKTRTKTTKTTVTNKPLISQDRKEIDPSSFSIEPKLIPAIIFGIIIPISCLFIIFLWNGYAYRTAQIGRYISENIEIKINRHYFAEFLTKYKPMSWETYMQSETWHPMEGLLVGLVFGVIGIPSSTLPLFIFNIPSFVLAWYWWYLSPIITSGLLVVFIISVFGINKIRNSKNSKAIIANLEEINEDQEDPQTKLKPLKLLAWKDDASSIIEAKNYRTAQEISIVIEFLGDIFKNPIDNLENGQIEQRLQIIGAKNIADIAREVREDTNIPHDDKWNQFIARLIRL